MLSAAAAVEARFAIASASPSAAVFPLLASVSLSVGAIVVFGDQLRQLRDATYSKSVGESDHDSPFPGVYWICGMFVAVIIGGVFIGGTLSVLAYMRFKVRSSWSKSAITAMIIALVIPFTLRKTLGMQLPLGVLNGY